MVKVLVPDLGEGIDRVEVASWHVAVGDRVRKDQDLVELVTDKAVFHLPSPADGVLKTIHVQPGQEARVGGLLGEIN